LGLVKEEVFSVKAGTVKVSMGIQVTYPKLQGSGKREIGDWSFKERLNA
jgi:hypothetical protein